MAWTTIFDAGHLSVSARDYYANGEGRVQTLQLCARNRGDEVTYHDISPAQIIDLGRRIIAAGEKLVDDAATARLEAHLEREKEATLAELDAQFAATPTPASCYVPGCIMPAIGGNGRCADHDTPATVDSATLQANVGYGESTTGFEIEALCDADD